jgi:hypothetical protein
MAASRQIFDDRQHSRTDRTDRRVLAGVISEEPSGEPNGGRPNHVSRHTTGTGFDSCVPASYSTRARFARHLSISAIRSGRSLTTARRSTGARSWAQAGGTAAESA